MPNPDQPHNSTVINIKVGDIVQFNWHGKMIKGKVTKLNPITVV